MIADPTEISSVPNSVNRAGRQQCTAAHHPERQRYRWWDGVRDRLVGQHRPGFDHRWLRCRRVDSGPNDVGDLVQGNFIGQYFVSEFDPITGVALPAPNSQIFTGIGNSLQGVLLGSTNATIGGFDPQENNVIAGNGQQGVLILAGRGREPGPRQSDRHRRAVAGGRYAIASNGSDGVLIASGSTRGLRLQQRHWRGYDRRRELDLGQHRQRCPYHRARGRR